MTADGAVNQPIRQAVAPAAQAVDDQRQRDLVQPGIDRLAYHFLRRAVAEGCGIVREALPEDMRAFVEKEASVEIKVPPPVVVWLAKIETAFEIELECIVERFPDLGPVWTIKLGAGPCAFATQRGTGPLKVKGHARDVARDQGVGVEKDEGFAFGQCHQAFDLVSIGVFLPEMLAFKG